jgi:hypothetical protein
LNGTTALNCSLLTFYFEILNGQNVTTIPRWIGISAIQGRLTDIQNALATISQNTDNIFKNASNNFINTDPPQFENNVNTLNNNYGQSTLPNPNPAASQKGTNTRMTPDYITVY